MNISLFNLAMKVLVAKKQRLLFTCIGIAFGIGLLISMSILYEKMDQALNEEIKQQYGAAELRIGFRNARLLDQNQIKNTQSLPGLNDSAVILVNPQQFTKEYNGSWNGIYYVGLDNSSLSKELYNNRKDLDQNEVAISEKLAKKLKAQVSEEVNIPFPSGKTVERVVKEIIPSPDAPGAPELAVFNLSSLQKTFELNNQANLLLLDLNDKINQKEFAKVLKKEIAPDLDIDVVAEFDDVKENIRNMKFIGFGVGLLVLILSGLYFLSNFQLSIRQREKELAILRAIGANRIQIFKLVINEAIILNTIGTILGMALGILLAQQLSHYVANLLNVSLVSSDIDWPPVVAISIVGWLFMILSVLLAAWRTVKIAPIQAMRENEIRDYKPSKWQSTVTILLLFLGIGMLLTGMILPNEGSGGLNAFLGLLGGLFTILGCFTGAIYGIPIIAAGLHPIMKKLAGKESFIAFKNFTSQRKQNTMIVVLLSASIMLSIIVPSILTMLKSGMEQNAHRQYVTDIVVSSDRFMESTIPYEFTKIVGSLDGVKAVIPLSILDSARIVDYDFSRSTPEWLEKNSDVSFGTYGIKQSDYLSFMYTDLQKMSENGIIPYISVDYSNAVVFSKSYADNLGVKTGDKITIKHFPHNGDQKVNITLTVASIVNFIPGDGTDGNVLIDRSNPYLKTNKELPLRTIFLDIDKTKQKEVLTGLINLQRDYPEISWGDLQTELNNIHQQMNQRFTILWAVLAVVSLIGCFGIVNTLSASIHAQRREYAILRAVRITPYELNKIIVLQGVLFSSIATIIGTVTGILMTYGFSVALDAKFIISWNTLIIIACSVLIISFVVSIPFAKRLGKKSITAELIIE